MISRWIRQLMWSEAPQISDISHRQNKPRGLESRLVQINIRSSSDTLQQTMHVDGSIAVCLHGDCDTFLYEVHDIRTIPGPKTCMPEGPAAVVHKYPVAIVFIGTLRVTPPAIDHLLKA